MSWHLMIGKNPPWVAKPHGRSIATMLRAYTAWAEGASEIDIAAIRRSMDGAPAKRFGTGFGSRRFLPAASGQKGAGSR